MGQPVVDKDAAGQGKYLRLVLQAPERSRENKAVIVALEFGPVVFFDFIHLFQSEPFVG